MRASSDILLLVGSVLLGAALGYAFVDAGLVRRKADQKRLRCIAIRIAA